jgi:hypothetical protein
VSLFALIFLVLPMTLASGNAPQNRDAPTVYIVGKADYDGDPFKVHLRGATNLPPKSLLLINVYDSIGEGSRHLSAKTVAPVSADGFFEATLATAPGEKFRHNMVCNILFMPKYPSQEASVLAIVGSEGENLGFPRNPQTEQHSEEYYLSELIHVP